MIEELQFGLDAIVDGLASFSPHVMSCEGPTVGGEDESQDSDECDNFHDILNIRINLMVSIY